jgi:uncharacterized protein (DUF362 family)
LGENYDGRDHFDDLKSAASSYGSCMTGDAAYQTTLDRLAGMALATGGWGYRPGQSAHLEPTCYAVLALSAHRETYLGIIQKALSAIESYRQSDGTYRHPAARPEAAWTTSLVLLTYQRLNKPHQAIADRLLGIRGRVMKKDPEVLDMVDIDVSLLGWPWAFDTFSWVEPTSWACTALRAAGQSSHTRVKEGLRLLLDRAFESGGVNYGNRVVLGKSTEPIPGPTAALLIALQGAEDQPRIDAAIGYLRVEGQKTGDIEHLAWSRLALGVHDDDHATRDAFPIIEHKIVESLGADPADGLQPGPLHLALAALALNASKHNPFAIAGSPEIAPGRINPEPVTTLKDDEPKPGLMARVTGAVKNRLLNALGAARPLPAFSAVHIAKAEHYDLALVEILREQFKHFQPYLDVRGKRVVLKPNIVEYHPQKVINTDYRVIDAAIQLFQAEGASEVIVAEGPGHWRNVTYLVNECGLGAVLKKRGVRFVDINHDEPVKLPNIGRRTGLDFLYLSKTCATADVFVSMPKLKTHHWAGVTLSLKNLFGTLPGICYGWPKNELHWRGIENSIIDIAMTNTPHLAIVDGIIGMEGDGPLNGRNKPFGALIMGMDLVAVDATCTRLMKLPAERIVTLAMAAHKRLGRLNLSDIPMLGESIDSMAQAFEPPPKFETLLMAGS